MPTKREALAEVGLAIAGARGKFSKVANEWLDNQRKAGVKFSDDDAPVRVARPVTVKEEKVEKPTGAVGYPDYIFPSDFRYPEAEYQAFARVGGKKVYFSVRECCNTCRVSLTNHGCETPTIHGNITVTLERR